MVEMDDRVIKFIEKTKNEIFKNGGVNILE